MAEIYDILSRMTGDRFAGRGGAGMSLPMLPQGYGPSTTPALPYFSGLGAQQGPLPSMGFQPDGMQMMRGMPPRPEPKNQGQLPQGSYDKFGSTMTGPYTQQVYPHAADAGFGDTSAMANRLQIPRFGQDSAPEPGAGMGGVRQDPNRLPYEETPQEAPQETKGGRLDRQQAQQTGGLHDLITPDMKQIIRQMIQQRPELAKNPRLVGMAIAKMMPFMHKRQQEAYQQRREEHTMRMESLAQERAGRAERMEQYKYLHDREQYVTHRMDKAWDRIKTLSDPLVEFAGDKKAELAKQQAYLKTYEDQLQSVVNDAHQSKKEAPAATGEGVYAKGAQGRPSEPAAAKPAVEKGPPQIFQLQADDIDSFVGKVKPALTQAKSLADKELIIRNTFDHINKQLQADGKSPLSLPDANKLLVRLGRDAYDPRTYGKKLNDWVSDSVKSWFPDYQESDMVRGDLGFASRFYGNLLNPAEYEHMLAEGMQTAADSRPTTEQMLTDRKRSGPERLMGGFEALGGALGPLGMAEAPGAMALGQSVGGAVQDATDNPWLGMLAGGLAGGGSSALRGRTPAGMPPQGSKSLGGPPTAQRIPYFPPDVGGGMSQGAPPFDPMRGMMGGSPQPAPSAPQPSGQMGAMPKKPGMQAMQEGAFPKMGQPAPQPGMQGAPPTPQPAGGAMPGMTGQPAPRGTRQLPPPGSFPPSAGGRGQPAYRPPFGPAFEMPDPSIRMGGPGEQLRLPAPTPSDPVSMAEAAAEIASGKEPAAPASQPAKPLQGGGGPFGVNQFGDHTVGDSVKFNGRTRKIEELIPARPGHLAPKARLSGLKLPVTLTKIEPVSMAKAGKFAEGDRVKWDLPAGFGAANGTVQKITVSPRGNAMATVKRSDGQVVDVDVSSLKNV